MLESLTLLLNLMTEEKVYHFSPVMELEQSIVATIKSITLKEDLLCDFADIHESFNSLNQNNFCNNTIKLPKILSGEDVQYARFVGDLATLYLKYHNPQIHQKYQFLSKQKQQLFDDLEKSRLVILGSKKYGGIKLNLQKIIEEEVKEIVEIWDISALLIKKSLSILDNTKTANFKKNVTNFLTNLAENTENQESFAEVSVNFINKIDCETKEAEEKPKNSQDNYQNYQQKSSNSQNPAKKDKKIVEKDVEKTAKTISLEINIDDNKKQIQKSSQASSIASKPSKSNEIEFVKEYKIFTKQYDLIVNALDLSDKLELEKLRSNLDLKIKNLEKISHKLKAKLKRKLLSKKIIFNEYNKEEGFIDPKKLTRLLTNPLKKNNYLQIKENQYQDTIISILIDNSGSMRGSPIIMSIMACEIIVQILEKFSIKTEILGFTTSKWHGGKSKKLWQMSGCPQNSGRLSDLCHIIYKTSNQSLKKSKLNLALMLKEGVLKENIDGEALLWATKRLNSYPQNRKILMVISDGAPVDDSTISHNEKDILTNHLKRVILQLEKKSNIELTAIGIGHDVSNFYQNSITIKNLEDLGDSMIDKICDLL